MRKYRYEIGYTKKAKQPYHVRLKAPNGRLLSSTENLSSRQDAIKNIKSQVKANLRMTGSELPGTKVTIHVIDFSKGLTIHLTVSL